MGAARQSRRAPLWLSTTALKQQQHRQQQQQTAKSTWRTRTWEKAGRRERKETGRQVATFGRQLAAKSRAKTEPKTKQHQQQSMARFLRVRGAAIPRHAMAVETAIRFYSFPLGIFFVFFIVFVCCFQYRLQIDVVSPIGGAILSAMKRHVTLWIPCSKMFKVGSFDNDVTKGRIF